MILPAESTYEAIFYDGKQAVRREARVELANRELTLTVQGEDPVVWPYEAIRIADQGTYGEPVRIEFSTGGTLVVEAHGFTEALRQFGVMKSPAIPLVANLDLRSWPTIIFCCIAIVCLGAGYYVWAVKWASETISRFLPPSVEERLGQAVIAVLAPPATRCTEPQATARLQPVVDRLASTARSPYKFRVIYVNQPVVNAFAAPGGYVVVFRGLLDVTNQPEEFAGVLAHEMEHVLLRHSTRAIAREFSGRAMLSLMAVDSNGTPTAIQAAARLANLSYQRDDEEAADLAGAALLDRAGMRTDGLAKFLAGLQGASGAFGPPQYLSTHPALSERVDALNALTRKYSQTRESVMSAEAWETARHVCRAE